MLDKVKVLNIIVIFSLATLQLNFFLMFFMMNQRLKQMKKSRGILSSVLEHRSKKRGQVRSCWVKRERTDAWWTKFVKNEVTPSEWKDNFRMSRKNFVKLCNLLRPYLQKKTTRLRALVSVEAQFGLYLYYVSDEGRFRKTANAFGIARSTVSNIIRKVSHAIVKFLAPSLLMIPESEDEVRDLADNFFEVSWLSSVHRRS